MSEGRTLLLIVRAIALRTKITGRVTELVVEALEVIDIDHDYGFRSTIAFSAVQLATHDILKVAAVVEPGEAIAQRHLAQLVAEAEIGERRTHAVGHRPQAPFHGPLRAASLTVHFHRDMEQPEHMSLPLQRQYRPP